MQTGRVSLALRSFWVITLRKGMNLFIPLVMDEIISLLFFYKDGLGMVQFHGISALVGYLGY